MELTGKKALVVGMARSGLASARVLLEKGAQVSICDLKPASDLGPVVREMTAQGAMVVTGSYPEVDRYHFDLLVASPGISLEIPPFRQALAQGIPVVGEVELAYSIKPEKLEICAVTGTNGKTTSTALLEHIFLSAGLPAAAAGNIGVPLTSLVEKIPEGLIALELSSFQLETIIDFRAHLCGVLNITPDHLDRHKTMENYIKQKARIFKNQKSQDYCVLNWEDPLVYALAPLCPGQVKYFSNQRILKEGAFIESGQIKIADQGGVYSIVGLDQLKLRGRHNLENILCSSLLAWLAGLSPETIGQAIATFAGVRHRMEEINTPGGVLYVNDSKATNPDSTIKALESFAQPVILIAGGRNKGSRFDVLAQAIKQRVKELILLGEAKEELRTAVIKAGFKNIHVVEDFPQAVLLASRLAQNGDVVMLSPACASWDMFKNYEQRGDLFCQLVRELA